MPSTTTVATVPAAHTATGSQRTSRAGVAASTGGATAAGSAGDAVFIRRCSPPLGSVLRCRDQPGADGVVRRLVDQDEAARLAVARVRVERERCAETQAHMADLVEREAVAV